MLTLDLVQGVNGTELFEYLDECQGLAGYQRVHELRKGSPSASDKLEF